MKKLIPIFSLILSALLCIIIPYNIYTLIFLPGLLFGVALTFPIIYSKIKDNFLQLKIMLLYPVVWGFVLWVSAFFELIIKNSADKTGYFLVGLISGVGVSMLFDWQFSFRNKLIGYFSISILSIIIILANDYFFPNSADKEQYFGEQIAIWQIIVGIGMLLNKIEKK